MTIRKSRPGGAVDAGCWAFTLIEVLAVVAIVLVMASLAIMALGRGGGGARMGTTVANLMNALTQARSEAIARNLPVQVRLVASDSEDPNTAGRAYSIWVRNRDGSSEQVTAWIRIPTSIAVVEDAAWFDAVRDNDPALGGTNAFDAGGSLISDVPYLGRTVSAVALEFSPTGGVRLPAPTASHSYVLLAPTVPTGSGTDLSARSGEVMEVDRSNWRQIRISNLTGQMQMNAPGL